MSRKASVIENPTAIADVHERIRQLGRRRILELPQIVEFHTWLDGKRLARQSCRVVGESRTGKTVSCDTYHLKCKATQRTGEAPTIPVMYAKSHELRHLIHTQLRQANHINFGT